MQNVRFEVWSSLRVVLFWLCRIRQCVGEKNYKYFVSFLFLHAIWCLFLSYIGARSLMGFIERIKFYDMQFNMGGQVVRGDGWLAVQVKIVKFSIFSWLIQYFSSWLLCAALWVSLYWFLWCTISIWLETEQQLTKEWRKMTILTIFQNSWNMQKR